MWVGKQGMGLSVYCLDNIYRYLEQAEGRSPRKVHRPTPPTVLWSNVKIYRKKTANFVVWEGRCVTPCAAIVFIYHKNVPPNF